MGGGYHDGASTLIRRGKDTGDLSLGHVITQQEHDCLQPGRELLLEQDYAGTLI